MLETKVCIVGSGFSALYCQLFLQRAGIDNVMVTGAAIGGQIMYTSYISNYFGADGFSGEKLIDECRAHLRKYNSKYIVDICRSITLLNSKYRFEVRCSKNVILCDYIVFCTGARAKTLNIKNEDKILYDKIFTCASCEADSLRDSSVAIIGGGEKAIFDALYCSKICSTVYVIVRKDKFKYIGEGLNYIRSKPNISIYFNTELVAIDDNLNYVFKSRDSYVDIKADYILLAIGHKPNTDTINFVNCQLDCDSDGYVIVDNKHQTSIEGLYAAGENMDPDYQQLITSGSQGAIAAMNIMKLIR